MVIAGRSAAWGADASITSPTDANKGCCMKPGTLGIVGILAVFAILHLTGPMPAAGTRALVATLIGGLAFLLMGIAIVLSTRPVFLEGAFGGLDRMYQAHKVCGVSAGFLVLAHFIAAPGDLPAGADATANSLVPSAPLGMIALVLLVISLALTLNRKVAYHRWRIVHRAMGVIFIIAAAHFLTAPAVFLERTGGSGLLLMAAAAIGVLAFLGNLLGLTRRGGHRFVVEAVNPLERATEVVLKPRQRVFEFIPGQFALIEMSDRRFREPHPFTISSAPGEDRLRFSIKVLGDWTRQVRDALTPGGDVLVRGPYGRFVSDPAAHRQVWLAGGIGITPFLSMVRAMQPDDPRQVLLVYAVRDLAEALFLDELRQREATIPGLRLVLRQSNRGEFADIETIRENLGSPIEEAEYFLCGPRPMVEGLSKSLKTAGVPRSKRHFEAFEFR